MPQQKIRALQRLLIIFCAIFITACSEASKPTSTPTATSPPSPTITVSIATPRPTSTLIPIDSSPTATPLQITPTSTPEVDPSPLPTETVTATVAVTTTTPTTPQLTVDVTTPLHPISPLIYGVNLADEEAASMWQLPINRWGGNALSRYNWQIDVYNPGNYWYFENISNPDVGTLPVGSTSDQFVAQNQRTETASVIQVPAIGWVAKSRDFDCGFRVSRYGEQSDVDWIGQADGCGNGVEQETGELIRYADPTDTSFAIDPTFVQDWVSHLNTQFGGVPFYTLDNEPMLWHHNHRDVHPQTTTYNEVRDFTYAYGAAIKTADPNAQILGPSSWGWNSYFYSSRDTEDPNANPDFDHYQMPFLVWYLTEMRRFEEENGYRLLDYLDIHYYPQAYVGENPIATSSAGDAEMQALRLRSTKDLWHPTYVAESWVAEPVYLIPRMRQWIDQHYPGTKLAISEYRWGALDHINGALAQADVLGIFGREQVGMAMLWDAPALGEPGDFAIRMFRNYDGLGGTFGDVALRAASTDPDQLAIYAAQHSESDVVTIMVINKTNLPIATPIELVGANNEIAGMYRYSSADLSRIVREPNVEIVEGRIEGEFSAESITLFVLTDNPAPFRSHTTTIFDDEVDAQWLDWSWGTTLLTQSAEARDGNSALAATFDEGWTGVYFHQPNSITVAENDRLRFWVRGGRANVLRLHLTDASGDWLEGYALSPANDKWVLVDIPFSALGIQDTFALSGIILGNPTENAQTTFYLDDLHIIHNPQGE